MKGRLPCAGALQFREDTFPGSVHLFVSAMMFQAHEAHLDVFAIAGEREHMAIVEVGLVIELPALALEAAGRGLHELIEVLAFHYGYEIMRVQNANEPVILVSRCLEYPCGPLDYINMVLRAVLDQIRLDVIDADVGNAMGVELAVVFLHHFLYGGAVGQAGHEVRPQEGVGLLLPVLVNISLSFSDPHN